MVIQMKRQLNNFMVKLKSYNLKHQNIIKFKKLKIHLEMIA